MTGTVNIIDVGHGNAAIAQGDGWTVMVDAAPAASVIQAIEHLGVNRVDRLVVSHRDHDHAGGVVPLLARRELEIDTIFIAADAAKNPNAPATALLLAALEDAKVSGRCRVSRDLDDALPAGTLDGGGLTVEVLAPTFSAAMTGVGGENPAEGTMTSNTVSGVVRIVLPGGRRVLLPGDIDDIVLRELLENGADLSADALVFPHHGSLSAVPDEQAFAAEITAAVRPDTVLFSVSRTSAIRPTEAVLRGIFEVDPEVRIACTQLSTGCQAYDGALPQPEEVTHLSGVPAAGRRRGSCCAGTVVLDSSGMAEPAPADHEEYLVQVADRPMCIECRPNDV